MLLSGEIVEKAADDVYFLPVRAVSGSASIICASQRSLSKRRRPSLHLELLKNCWEDGATRCRR